MKLEIIALLVCTIMGRRRRRVNHHSVGETYKEKVLSKSVDSVEEGAEVVED
jgi:hypothetical protein